MAREDAAISTTALVGLQGQLNTVRSEIFTTNVNLQSIARLVQIDTSEDQRRLFEQQEQERRLLENKIRVGQEEALQQRLSASLVPPVVKLEKKLNSTFGNITSALLALFGFFGTKVIQGIQFSSRLGLGALGKIGDTLKGFFGLITGTLGTIGKGFTSIISGIGGITGKVLKAIGALALSPFKAIADLVRKIIPGAGGAAAGAEAGGIGARFLNILGLGGRVLAGGAALQSAAEGDLTGAAISGAAALVPNPVTIIGALGYTGAKAFGLNPQEIISQGFQDLYNGVSSFISAAPAAASQINFNQMNPFSGEFNLNNAFGSLSAAAGSMVNSGGSPPPASSSGSSGPDAVQSPRPVPLTVIPHNDSQIQPPPRQPPPPAEPTPQPDVIYMTNGQNQQAPVVSGDIPTLTDVPLIPSANPDNFYAIYAQVNYNVVL